MKRYVWAAFAAVAVLSGCAKEILSEPETASVNPDEGILITFTAEKADCDALTRAAISPEDSKVINWSDGDEISVFDAAGVNCRFELKEGAGTPAAKFEGKVTKTAESYTALYPYQAEAALEVDSDGTIHYHVFENVLIKTEQKAVEGSFDPEAAVMTARSEKGSNSLQFRNLMGFLKLIPKSDCSRITFTPTDWPEGVLYGYCKVVLEENEGWNPRFGGGGSVESISISGDIKAGKAYYIAVGPSHAGVLPLPNGFSLTFSTDELDTFKRTSNALEINRNTVVNLGEIEGVAESYLRFSADAEQSFSIAPMDSGKFEYSVGNGNWTALNLAAGSSGSETVKFGGDKGDLKLRGKSAEGTWCTTKNQHGRIWFDYNSGIKVHCSGDIRTLVDWENYKTVDTGKAVFKMLFTLCSQLLSAPELPATKLADNCYEGMFSYCSSLEKSPKLPATELSKECYKNMFYECTSLYSLPELPAPAVPENAYSAMFYMCTNIYYAPDLPAMQVSSNGYSTMFCGCTSLRQMPKIAATSLGDYAMASMFSGCVNLDKTTALPDVAPSRGCYSEMFKGCTALKVAPEIPSKETAAWCYDQMFAGSGLEKAPDLLAESVADYAYKSMFEGCQSLTVMPEIAATTVGQNGMTFMFKSCSNLKTATDLKITDFTGTYNCAEMFHYCPSLTSAPALPATELADHCYFCMFSGCTSLEKSPAELPATVLAGYCYEQMFRSCSELKTAPKLPAKTLATMCCNQMFYDCKKLTDAPELPAEKMEESCYRAMFKGCSALVSAPVLKVTEIAKECCYSMFENCSALQNVTLDVNDFDNDGAFTDWLNGTAADGKLHIRAGLNETTKWCMNLPSGWSFVEDITD